MSNTQDAIVLSSQASHKKTVIWLHGLGADGHDFAPLIPELKLPEALGIKWILPHAPVRPITLNGGLPMRGWYDIKTLDRENFVHDKEGVLASCALINALIADELKLGLSCEDILLVGFSQGGAIALATTLLYSEAFAGTLALSSYLPAFEGLLNSASSQSRHTSIAQFHGVYDDIVPLAFAELSKDALKAAGYQVQWRTYPMAHSVCSEEVADIKAFIESSLSGSHA